MPLASNARTFDIVCTNCGAKLTVDRSTPTPVCGFCGTQNVLAPEVWREIAPKPPPVAAAAPEPVLGTIRSTVWLVVGLAVGLPVVIGLVIAAVTMNASAHLQSLALPAATFAAPNASRREPFVAPNSPCEGLTAACSSDRQSMLKCANGKLVVADTCKGPKGCRAIEQGNTVSCDTTRADENDPCVGKDSACSTDGKSELRCDGAKYARVAACGGPDGCSTWPGAKGGYTLRCDDDIAPEGAPCLNDGDFACSPDVKSLLRCTGGKFVLAAACRGPCKMTKNRVDDTTTFDCVR